MKIPIADPWDLRQKPQPEGGLEATPGPKHARRDGNLNEEHRAEKHEDEGDRAEPLRSDAERVAEVDERAEQERLDEDAGRCEHAPRRQAYWRKSRPRPDRFSKGCVIVRTGNA